MSKGFKSKALYTLKGYKKKFDKQSMAWADYADEHSRAAHSLFKAVDKVVVDPYISFQERKSRQRQLKLAEKLSKGNPVVKAEMVNMARTGIYNDADMRKIAKVMR
jgi:hypothetical protein